jgi:hypothetical protein
MRLVLIHGRAQDGRCAADIHAEWMPALERGCDAAGTALPPDLDVRVPYYGDILAALVVRPADYSASALPRGDSEPPDEFEASVILALARGAGIRDTDIAAETHEEAVERGPQSWSWVQAAGRLLSRRYPWLGELLMRELTADVNAYMTQPDVCASVNERISIEIGAEPVVVVGHSLGSIVGYWTLTKFSRPLIVPLFVTLGSPLGIDIIKARLPRPLGMPPPVQHWFNAADERDPVALVSRLDRDHFPANIENASDIHNPKSNPHAIVGYLSDPLIAERIAKAVNRS